MLKPNYEYVLEKCSQLAPPGGKILDYGCGKGVVVEEAVRRELDMYGVEAFSYGSGVDIKSDIESNERIRDRVRELDLESGIIDFPDNSFDLVVSNQVFEHVKDMHTPLQEIRRVLKPDGKALLIFPSIGCIREGHCGILFAHWLPHSRLRYYWILLNRLLGIGRMTRRRGKREWAHFYNEWLVDSVTYRSLRDIHKSIDEVYAQTQHIEDDYLRFRFDLIQRPTLAKLSINPRYRRLAKLFARTWGSLVMVIAPGE